LDTPIELFEHELRDIYDAENKLKRALERMAKKAPDQQLSQGFEQHRRETQDQLQRLEEIFQLLGRKPRREPCAGINGLIEEFSEFVKEEDPSEEVLNLFIIGAALKVEHYEIVAYQSLMRLAGRAGLTEAVDLLAQNLLEEQQTAERLERLADLLGGPLPSLAVVDQIDLSEVEA
jgi:ferritin-like metal-binding protein YciE